MRLNSFFTFLSAFALLTFSELPTVSAQSYSVTDLGPDLYINDMVSTSRNSSSVKMVGDRYDPNTLEMTTIYIDLRSGEVPLPIPTSLSTGSAYRLRINKHSRIVGKHYGDNGQFSTLLWESPEDVPAINEELDSFYHLNNSNQVLGREYICAGNSCNYTAVLSNWTEPPLYLETTNFPLFGVPLIINERQTILGQHYHPATQDTLFVFDLQADELRYLLPFGFDETEFFDEGKDMNNRSEIVGRSVSRTTWRGQALYSDGTYVYQLDCLAGHDDCSLDSINSRGVAVGYSLNDSDNHDSRRAVIWDSRHGMRDLNSLVPTNFDWILINATQITDHGHILVEGVRDILGPNFESRTFILSPRLKPYRADNSFDLEPVHAVQR